MENSSLVKNGSNSSLQSAFEEPYIGIAHQCFVDALNRYSQRNEGEATSRLYNKSVSVIQSSGMGKSRMVDEAANMVFTIPANLREDLPEGMESYPPPDKALRSYFENHESKSDELLQAEYAILLTEIFNVVASKVPTVVGDLKGSESAAVWAEHLRFKKRQGPERVKSHPREEFYRSVAKKARKRRDGIFEMSGDVQRLKDPTKLEGLLSALDSSAKHMLDVVVPGHSDEKNACYVYFDEAHNLTKPPQTIEGFRSRNPYQNLGKVLSRLRNLSIFFIFLSTNTHIQEFAPLDPSARASEGTVLIPPYTELPFDIFITRAYEKLKGSGKTRSLVNVCTTDVMSSMGRPLWFVNNNQWEKQKFQPMSSKVNHALDLAADKLTAQGFGRKSRSRLAALSVRIGITFESVTQASREMESRQVESHMRIVYAIPEHREYMRTGSPSEPILAEAAASYLNRIHNGAGIAIVGPRILSKNCQKGFIGWGGRGELCGRLLMTIAHDTAVLKTGDKIQPFPKDPRVQFHRPIPVIAFLRTLFADEHHNTVLKATSITNKNGETLKDAFKNAYICFSHFALAEDSKMFEAKSLRTALFRGMAMQAKDNQTPIDAVIPIHMGSITSPITTETTSAINLQFKSRKRSYSCSVDRNVTVPDPKQPVISIVFELGVEQSELPLVEAHHWNRPDTQSDQSALCSDDNHYSFVARGCGPETFKAVPEKAKGYYHTILATGDLKSDFPRADDQASWELVQELKSTFIAAKSWAKWDEWDLRVLSSSTMPGTKRSAEEAMPFGMIMKTPNDSPEHMYDRDVKKAKTEISKPNSGRRMGSSDSKGNRPKGH
ncbi:unnamed protein product [Rhizoctonia solani]|uniref:Uncharacterized protein n=1 Tax=Rhizoctonia solani TaxID=456999 RepID=A0A8H3D336_9AGAM|nr:unnamed protein product [Rhizoctonia solani]